MGAQTDRLRCEVFQNLILSPINTGFLRHAVATALTVYGIETIETRKFTLTSDAKVATALTVYGIETQLVAMIFLNPMSLCCNSPYRLRY